MKAPKVRVEARPPTAPRTEEGRPMGIDLRYKDFWK